MSFPPEAQQVIDQLRKTLQDVMQVLGPEVPDVDYTDPGNAAGLTSDVTYALTLLRKAGITYQPRTGGTHE